MVFVTLVNGSFSAKEDYKVIKGEIKNDLDFIELTEVLIHYLYNGKKEETYRKRYINKIHIVDVISDETNQ